MSEQWPTVDLDPVRRLHVMAAAFPAAVVVERLIPAPFEQVWAFASDLEANLPRYQPNIRAIDYRQPVPDAGTEARLEAIVHAKLGITGNVSIILRPGWCWMQGQHVLVGMAARPENGQTRFARLHVWRFRGARLIEPVVRGGAANELRRLERLILSEAE